MIKFFRIIRQKLITDLPSGKFSKYMLYAVGEIVLVVIGILIALQINNWNENRKNQLKQVDLIDVLIMDMNEKMNENIADLAFGEKMIATTEKAMNDLKSGSNVDTADIKDILRYIGTDSWFYVTTTPTYNNVINSDLWHQLPDTLAQKIQTIYDIRSTRVRIGFEKVTGYATDCRLNYLVPKELMDSELDPMALSMKVAEDLKSFRARLVLFMNGVNRQNRSFAGSRDAIKEVIPLLTSYRDDLAGRKE